MLARTHQAQQHAHIPDRAPLYGEADGLGACLQTPIANTRSPGTTKEGLVGHATNWLHNLPTTWLCARTCVVDEVRVVGVRRDNGDQVGARHVQLRQLEEGGAAAAVVLPQEPLQVLEAHCAQGCAGAQGFVGGRKTRWHACTTEPTAVVVCTQHDTGHTSAQGAHIVTCINIAMTVMQRRGVTSAYGILVNGYCTWQRRAGSRLWLYS